MLLQTVQRGDVRVIELGKESGFPLETVQAFFVPCKLLRKNLDGDLAAERHVPSAVDLAHAPLADGLGDLLVGEFVARLE